MRCISLWQPWATAMAVGTKHNETRHWSTPYRGLVAIHAARRKMQQPERDFASVECCLGRLPKRIPFGAIVAVGRLVNVLPTSEAVLTATGIERQWGNYEPGRFAWIFENVLPLAEPIPYIGRQGFFNVPDELLPAPLLRGIPDLGPITWPDALHEENSHK